MKTETLPTVGTGAGDWNDDELAHAFPEGSKVARCGYKPKKTTKDQGTRPPTNACQICLALWQEEFYEPA